MRIIVQRVIKRLSVYCLIATRATPQNHSDVSEINKVNIYGIKRRHVLIICAFAHTLSSIGERSPKPTIHGHLLGWTQVVRLITRAADAAIFFTAGRPVMVLPSH